MKAGVTKQEFINEYSKLLKMTRVCVDFLELVDDDTVIIHYESGNTRLVNIACNSAMAIIKDVAKQI